MSMTESLAGQVADLINAQNELTVWYTPAKILEHDRYIVRVSDAGEVLGVVEVKKVQWYQCEISHVSVAESAKRCGLGASLIQEAETRARQLGARIVQCTIRVGNVASEQLFGKCGYASTITFKNSVSDNLVTVYQKVL